MSKLFILWSSLTKCVLICGRLSIVGANCLTGIDCDQLVEVLLPMTQHLKVLCLALEPTPGQIPARSYRHMTSISNIHEWQESQRGGSRSLLPGCRKLQALYLDDADVLLPAVTTLDKLEELHLVAPADMAPPALNILFAQREAHPSQLRRLTIYRNREFDTIGSNYQTALARLGIYYEYQEVESPVAFMRRHMVAPCPSLS